VEAHLADCVACRVWQDAAHEVTRRVRLQSAHPSPARTSEVLAAVQARARVTRQPRTVLLARLALAGVAAAQLALTVPCLLYGHDHSAPEHIAHEMGAFDAALAVGFAVAAWRPWRALGMRALVGAAAALLVITAIADLAAGRTSLGDEAPHLLAVAGWLIICYLASVTPPPVQEARPMAVTWLRERLRAPSGQRAWIEPAAARGTPGGADSVVRRHSYLLGDAAGCGCAAARCQCPGCVASDRAAAG
jgi:predicted anti-sigma-YlaC factor YlaD